MDSVDIDAPDIKRELDWIATARTCEWCGDVGAKPLEKQWLCREDAAKHTKHTKSWRVCDSCLNKRFLRDCGKFDRVAFPIIRNMHPQSYVSSIVAVQPMMERPGLTFELDYIGWDAPVTDGRRELLDAAAAQLSTLASTYCGVRLDRCDLDVETRNIDIIFTFDVPRVPDSINVDILITPEGVQVPANG